MNDMLRMELLGNAALAKCRYLARSVIRFPALFLSRHGPMKA